MHDAPTIHTWDQIHAKAIRSANGHAPGRIAGAPRQSPRPHVGGAVKMVETLAAAITYASGRYPPGRGTRGSGRSSALRPAPSVGHTQHAYSTHTRRTHDAPRFHTERRDDGHTAHPRHTHRTYITHTSRIQHALNAAAVGPIPVEPDRCTADVRFRHPRRTHDAHMTPTGDTQHALPVA